MEGNRWRTILLCIRIEQAILPECHPSHLSDGLYRYVGCRDHHSGITALFFEQESMIFSSDVAFQTRSLLYGLLLASYPFMQFFGTPHPWYPVRSAWPETPLADLPGGYPFLGYLVFGYAVASQNIRCCSSAECCPDLPEGIFPSFSPRSPMSAMTLPRRATLAWSAWHLAWDSSWGPPWGRSGGSDHGLLVHAGNTLPLYCGIDPDQYPAGSVQLQRKRWWSAGKQP